MDIIIAGGGKVGMTMARQLAAAGHNLTIVDQNPQVVDEAVQRYDALGICGNCASREVLDRAAIAEAELVIAATNADEVNLLCCLTAHGMNPNVHTIARIRNPEYADQVILVNHGIVCQGKPLEVLSSESFRQVFHRKGGVR